MARIAVHDEERLGRDGARLRFRVWTTQSDQNNPLRGMVRIDVEVLSSGKQRSFGCRVPLAMFSRSWLRGFVEAFAEEPSFRARWERLPRNRAHPTEPLELDDGAVAVDCEIVAAVRALNERGHATLHSCQGDSDAWTPESAGEGGTIAYVAFRGETEMPDALRRAAAGAGMRVESRSIHADAPAAAIHVANQRFREMLRDWTQGRLDESGARYRVAASEVPRLHMPALP